MTTPINADLAETAAKALRGVFRVFCVERREG
jgi:hypothetical protein